AGTRPASPRSRSAALAEYSDWRENPNSAAARLAGTSATSVLRTISYLTCTRSAGSKNPPGPNAGSVTFSGRGFSVLDAASACIFVSSRLTIAPPWPRPGQDNYAGRTGRIHRAAPPGTRKFPHHEGNPGNYPADPVNDQPEPRRNPMDTHGIVRLTSSDTEPAPWRSSPTSSASSSRSAVRNGDRSADTTTNGSPG